MIFRGIKPADKFMHEISENNFKSTDLCIHKYFTCADKSRFSL